MGLLQWRTQKGAVESALPAYTHSACYLVHNGSDQQWDVGTALGWREPKVVQLPGQSLLPFSLQCSLPIGVVTASHPAQELCFAADELPPPSLHQPKLLYSNGARTVQFMPIFRV